MKYTVINEHSLVNFHDVHVNRVYFHEGNMIWELAGLQTVGYINNSDSDTQEYRIKYSVKDDYWIINAHMILENAVIESLLIGGYKQYNSEGILIDKRESVFASPDDYNNLLAELSFENSSYIFDIKHLPETSDRKYRINVATQYEITIAFAKSIITWDEFAGADYYQDKAWSNYKPN